MSSRIANACAAGLVLLAGCAPSTPSAPTAAKTAAPPAHDGHDHADHEHEHEDHGHDHPDEKPPESVAAGIAQLEKLCVATQAHLAAGDHDKADGPVHMVGHLLETLAELVAKEKPAAEAEARQALDAVFDCFDKIDTAIHASDDEVRRKLDYAEHAPAVEAAIAKLKDLMK